VFFFETKKRKESKKKEKYKTLGQDFMDKDQ
jgi:hypothetical protein